MESIEKERNSGPKFAIKPKLRLFSKLDSFDDSQELILNRLLTSRQTKKMSTDDIRSHMIKDQKNRCCAR